MPDITAATTDGVVYNDQNALGVNDGWVNCRNSSTGSLVQNAVVFNPSAVQVKKWSSAGSGRFTIRRSFFSFDTSAIDADPSADDCATAATLKIYGVTYGTADLIVVKATAPDLSTGVATGDFNALDGWNSSFTSSDLTAYSAEIATWSTSGYNEITLNSQALKDMNDSSVFKIAVIEYDHDYLGVEYNPGTSGEVNVGMYYNHASSLADGKRPLITYTAGPCGYGNDVLGVSSANIGEILGVATANIDIVLGVDD